MSQLNKSNLFVFSCQYCRLQKCLRVGMRIEAVQNERRPYTNKSDFQQSDVSNQRIRTNDDMNIRNHPLASMLNQNRDEPVRPINENKTLHSILTSSSTVKNPSTRKTMPKILQLNQTKTIFNFQLFSFRQHHHHHQPTAQVFTWTIILKMKRFIVIIFNIKTLQSVKLLII